MHGVAFGWLAWGGLATEALWRNLAWCAPAVVVGVLLGVALYGRLDDSRFRRLVALLLIGAGTGLVL